MGPRGVVQSIVNRCTWYFEKHKYYLVPGILYQMLPPFLPFVLPSSGRWANWPRTNSLADPARTVPPFLRGSGTPQTGDRDPPCVHDVGVNKSLWRHSIM